MKVRALPLAAPALLCLLLHALGKSYQGCSSSEASGWKGACYAQPIKFTYFPLFSPHTHISMAHRLQTRVFYPLLTSSINKWCLCMLYRRDEAMISRSMKDTWYISVTYRSTAAPYVMGLWEDGLSPERYF